MIAYESILQQQLNLTGYDGLVILFAQMKAISISKFSWVEAEITEAVVNQDAEAMELQCWQRTEIIGELNYSKRRPAPAYGANNDDGPQFNFISNTKICTYGIHSYLTQAIYNSTNIKFSPI